MDVPRAPAMNEPWIAADEPPPYEVVNGAGASRVILTCDHASPRIPRRLGNLGLSTDDLTRHVAWDIGAAAVARRLSLSLDAPLVLCGYSRLVIDCNRSLDRPDSITAQSENVRVRGNESITADERAGRAEAVFWPYHRAIDRLVGARAAGDAVPVMVSVHSFTPVYRGEERPWHIGVLYRRDRRLADMMLPPLRADGALCVGENEPYRVALDEDYTIPVHAEVRGIPHVLLEIRQDLVAGDDGARSWADRLTGILGDALADPGLNRYMAPAHDVHETRFTRETP